MQNFFNLLRLAYRQELFRIIIWTVVIAGLSIYELIEMQVMMNDSDAAQSLYSTLDMPSMVAMFGPIWQSASDASTIGVFGSIMVLFMILLAAVMNIFLIARYTRGDEESGNHEMLRALPIGHRTLLLVTLKLASSVNILIGIITFAGLLAVEQAETQHMSVQGALCYSLAVALGGMLFACITAVFAQVFASARYAIQFSGLVLAVLYVTRAFTDIKYTKSGEENIGTWLNPLALVLRSKPYVENNFWVLGVLFALTAVLAVLAVFLYSIRDLGQSFVQDREGHASAKAWLSGYVSVSIRLQRGSVIGWGLSLFAFGLCYGSIVQQMESFISKNEFLMQILQPKPGHSVTEMFISMIVVVLVLFACIPALNVALFPLREENKGRMEQLFAKSLSRGKVILTSIAQGFTTATFMLLIAALGLFISTQSSMEHPIGLANIMADTFVYLPATLTLVSVAVLLVGIGWRFSSGVAYGYLTYAFFVMYIGEILNLPQWMKSITPFGHVPDLVTDSMSWTPIIITSVVAIVISASGAVLYKRRDVM